MKKLRITVDGRAFDVSVEVLEDDGVVIPQPTASSPLASAAAAPAASKPIAAPAPVVASRPAAAGGKDVQSQVSGMVVTVDVSVGQRVEEGQQLVTIEAMKMNTYVMAPFAGTVTEILATKGKSVLAGDVLVRLD